MPDNPLYQDLMTLLSLLKSCQTSSINQIIPSHLQKADLPSNINYRNSQDKIQEIVFRHSKENGELVVKFWITLRKIFKIFIEKVKMVGIETGFIVRMYGMILEKLLGFVESRAPLSKVIWIVEVLKGKQEKEKEKEKQKQKQKEKEKQKEKQKRFESAKHERSIKLQKPHQNRSPPKKIQKIQKRNNSSHKLFYPRRENMRVIINNTKTNNKLFKDLDVHRSIQKYDGTLNRSSNSHLLYDEIYSRNKPAHRSITKYHNQSSSVPKQSANPELKKYYQSLQTLERGPGRICKSARKGQEEGKVRESLNPSSTNVVDNTTQHRNKRTQKPKSRPQSCKMSKGKSQQKPRHPKQSLKNTLVGCKQNKQY